MKEINEIVTSLKDCSDELMFGLGTSQIASLGRRLSYKDSRKLFKTAFDNNVNIIDTADMYGSGDAEYLIGKILKDTESNPFIITKAGFPNVSIPKWVSPVNQIAKKVKQKLNFKKRYHSTYLFNSLNKSLKRLQKKQAGAFLLHEPVWGDIESTDCWEGLAKIKREGLSYFTGVSTNDLKVINEGIETGQVDIVQTSVQFGNENSEVIINLCKSKTIPVIANEVFLPFRGNKYNLEKIMPKINILQGLEKIEPFQLLIGITYLETNPNIILLGTRDKEHLLKNIHSTDFFSAIKYYYKDIKLILYDNGKN